MENQKPPLPLFTMKTALQKVQLAQDAWNSKDPERVCLAYTINTEWRNRTEFINGREEIKQFLKRKWEKELDYKLKKNCGVFVKTEWQFVLNMNGAMPMGNGFAVTVMKIGSLTKMD